MGIELPQHDPEAGRVEAGMDGERFASPEASRDALSSPARAESLSAGELEAALSAGRVHLGIDDRNWHADDARGNLAASGMVRTRDGMIAEYRVGRDGTYALRTWVRDVSAVTPEEAAAQIALEAALLAAKTRGEAGAGALEWAATLRAPETAPVRDRVAGLIGSFRRRLNIDDKTPETDAEKPDQTLAA